MPLVHLHHLEDTELVLANAKNAADLGTSRPELKIGVAREGCAIVAGADIFTPSVKRN